MNLLKILIHGREYADNQRLLFGHSCLQSFEKLFATAFIGLKNVRTCRATSPILALDVSDVFVKLFDLCLESLLTAHATVSPLVHLSFVVIEIHKIVFVVFLKCRVNFIPLELADTLFIAFQDGLVAIKLVSELLLGHILESGVELLHCFPN